MSFYSTASLLAPDETPLTDDEVVAVWAESSAYNVDEDGNGDAVDYPDDVAIPLVAVDRDADAVGYGAPLANDDANFDLGNEEFVLNLWDEHVDGDRIVWDESHDQFYDRSEYDVFVDYAAENGYEIEGTDSLTDSLSDADGVVVTSPSRAFTDEEAAALRSFVDEGGALFLVHQSDFRDFDETANLNALADALNLDFRFNDDQVMDDDSNAGPEFNPVTSNFNDSFPYFEDRDGLGFEIDPTETYDVEVTEVADGDTVTVAFEEGNQESIRVLGVDTPESAGNAQFVRLEEWEGIEDLTYLQEWAAEATAFAEDELLGETVTVSFDPSEGVRDEFNRVLAYVDYDASGDASRDTTYNRELIARGLARVYGSGFGRHDEFWRAEAAARADGVGLWAESDPENSEPIRNRDVDDLFVPDPVTITTSDRHVTPNRVPVFAEDTAEGASAVTNGRVPLAAVDEDARVGLVAGPLIDESYEAAEDYPVDTSGYENFVFLTNLIDALADRTDDQVLIEGGHGQFAAGYALSNEDAAYYQRYLEGVGLGFEQVNEVTGDRLDDARAIVITTPAEAFGAATIEELRSFAADGGAVVLLGSSAAPTAARENLNALADGLGTDLRVGGGGVTDPSSNVNDDPSVPTTTAFNRRFKMFSAYDGADGSAGRGNGRGRGDGQGNGRGRGRGTARGK
ncbi:hypothetical protein G9464_20515 [Halostella sp. JP-L12]|nr:hypothetical protein [Halostella sp. JP-L12]